MRKTGVFLLIMVVLLFAGCAHDSSEAYYGLFEDEAALIAFEDKGTLFLVILPWSVVKDQVDKSGSPPSRLLMELGGMDPLIVVEGEGEELSRIRSLLTTLVVDTTDLTREEVEWASAVGSTESRSSLLEEIWFGRYTFHHLPWLGSLLVVAADRTVSCV
nr:hypothetical protein [uncultured Sphaerochaeta sp.]